MKKVIKTALLLLPLVMSTQSFAASSQLNEKIISIVKSLEGKTGEAKSAVKRDEKVSKISALSDTDLVTDGSCMLKITNNNVYDSNNIIKPGLQSIQIAVSGLSSAVQGNLLFDLRGDGVQRLSLDDYNCSSQDNDVISCTAKEMFGASIFGIQDSKYESWKTKLEISNNGILIKHRYNWAYSTLTRLINHPGYKYEVAEQTLVSCQFAK